MALRLLLSCFLRLLSDDDFVGFVSGLVVQDLVVQDLQGTNVARLVFAIAVGRTLYDQVNEHCPTAYTCRPETAGTNL